jgi:hypothetical protein
MAVIVQGVVIVILTCFGVYVGKEKVKAVKVKEKRSIIVLTGSSQ